MPTPVELKQPIWRILRSDMTVMLGLVDADESHNRPMTAMVDGDDGPIWFFTARDTSIVEALAVGGHGDLAIDNDRALIDRLRNAVVAARYEGGNADPKLVLLRLDPDHAQIWENGSSLLAGIRLLLGRDHRTDFRDQVAEVDRGDGVPG